jgi:hypothetical protein
MANSTRHGTQRQPPSQADPCPQDRAEIAKGKDGPIAESSPTLETPNLWHAAPRSECWTSTTVTESGSWGSRFAAPGRPARRLRRPPRRRTRLHCSRPFQGAEARFTSRPTEYLTD